MDQDGTSLPVVYHATQEIKDFLSDSLLHPAIRAQSMRSHAHPNLMHQASAFKSLDLVPETPYYGGQRPGFFVFTNPKDARHNIDPQRQDSRYDHAKNNPAMVATMQLIDRENWRPDYELHGVAVLKHIIAQTINGKPAGEFLIGHKTELFGEAFEVIKAEPRVIALRMTKDGRTSIGSISPMRSDPDDYSIADARKVQAICDIIEHNAPEDFKRINTEMVGQLLLMPQAALKYVGDQALPIMSREILIHGDWRETDSLAVRSLAKASDHSITPEARYPR